MNVVKMIAGYFLKYTDFILLGCLLLFKMYWFAKEVGIHMLRSNIIMVSIGSVLLLLVISFLFKRWNRLLVMTMISVLASIVIYADLVYFRYFGDFITTPVLQQSGQVTDISSSILELMLFQDIIYFVDLLFFFALYIFAKVKRFPQQTSWRERLISFTLVFAIGFYLVYSPINEYVERYGTNLFKNTWSNVSLYNVLGHLGFHAFETGKYVNENIINRPVIAEESKEEIYEWLQERKSPHLEMTEYFGIAKGMNLIILQLESYQGYLINREINGQVITPNLNELVGDSFYFDNFYHQVAQGRTSDAEFLVNNSLYPLPTGSVYVRYPRNEYESLPNFMHGLDYHTSVYHSFEKNFWNRTIVYDNYGFDDFFGKGDFREGQIAGPFESLGDEGVFLDMVDHTITKQPFYGFVVALTSHHPYTHIPAEHKTLNTEPFDGTIFANYLHSVHYVDYAVGVLIEEMKKNNIWDNTVLVIYGDHDSGIEFTEEHAESLGMPSDPISLISERDKVPLIIRVPGADGIGTYHQTSGMIDITPTILHLYGIEEETFHLGSNIFAFEDHLVPFRYGSFRSGPLYYQTALDGEFENGKCFQVEDRQEINVEACFEDFQETRTILQYSDQIIYHNLLKEF